MKCGRDHGKLSGKLDKMLEVEGVTLAWTSVPFRGGVVIILVILCFKYWN